MDILTPSEQAGLSSVAVASAHGRGLELLRVDLRGTRTRPVIEVILDGERQVTIDDCEVVSKDVQAHLDDVFGAKTNYRLDVLSPGVDEPLAFPYQYKRSIGRKIEVQTTDGLLTGILREVGTEGIILAPADKKRSKQGVAEPQALSFSSIERARVLVEL